MKKCPVCKKTEFDIEFKLITVREGDRMGWRHLDAQVCTHCGVMFIKEEDIENL